MKFLDYFRRNSGSAPVARDRLQIILAHERATLSANTDLLATLREEILAVIAKHMTIDRDKVNVSMDRGDDVSTLEVEVELPLEGGPNPLKVAAE